jgi:hypothetical protein
MRCWCNKITIRLADNLLWVLIRRSALKAANQFMEEVQGVFGIGGSRIDASLGEGSRDVIDFEECAPSLIPLGG